VEAALASNSDNAASGSQATNKLKRGGAVADQGGQIVRRFITIFCDQVLNLPPSKVNIFGLNPTSEIKIPSPPRSVR
jgi:hypothetical protein